MSTVFSLLSRKIALRFALLGVVLTSLCHVARLEAQTAVAQTAVAQTAVAQTAADTSSEALPIPPQSAAPKVVAPTTSTSTRVPALDASTLKLARLARDFQSNAALAERDDILFRLNDLARLLQQRDANALDLFKLDVAASALQPRVSISMSRLATSLRGGLARITLTFETLKTPTKISTSSTRSSKSASAQTVSVIASRVVFAYDIWFVRIEDGSFLPADAWRLPNDAATELSADAAKLWREHLQNAAPAKVPKAMGAISTTVSALMSPDVAANKGGDILTLVAEYRGGRWVALRAEAPWQGAILDAAHLARAAARMKNAATSKIANPEPSSTRSDDSPSDALSTSTGASDPLPAIRSVNDLIAPWLLVQMNRYRRRAAGTAHFIFQRGARGWVGVDSVFEPAKEASDAAYTRLDDLVRQSRADMSGEDYATPQAHYNYAQALFGVKLFNEAADELAKTAAMLPNLVTLEQSKTFENARRDDAQNRSQTEQFLSQKYRYDPDHPLNRVPQLQAQFRVAPNSLTALRISLEYSRLAYEREADAWFRYAMSGASQYVSTAKAPERAWLNVLRDQIRMRLDLAPQKPNNIIRSDLFTVRCTLNDPNIVQLLAGLEAAQYTIYSRFGVPMGNTEVIMWGSQSLFQNYTTRQAGRNTSEFVTALTLTQLVNADVGPVVLGEEINFFTDPRAGSISTIAHEYGHIAVRTLARGREVPDWFNEGVATYVEGGYENYQARLRNARQCDMLLPMRELQAWNVDGERAFLAYSQANSMIDYIVAQKVWGGDAVLEILRQIGADVPPNDAIKKVLRVSPQSFYNMWVQWLPKQNAARKKP